jgi:hypothetical protein
MPRYDLVAENAVRDRFEAVMSGWATTLPGPCRGACCRLFAMQIADPSTLANDYPRTHRQTLSSSFSSPSLPDQTALERTAPPSSALRNHQHAGQQRLVARRAHPVAEHIHQSRSPRSVRAVLIRPMHHQRMVERAQPPLQLDRYRPERLLLLLIQHFHDLVHVARQLCTQHFHLGRVNTI